MLQPTAFKNRKSMPGRELEDAIANGTQE